MNDDPDTLKQAHDGDSPGDLYWYDVDASDHLTDASENWNAFAFSNNAASLTADAVRNRPIWQFIADPTTREIYRELFAQVRRTGRTITIPYRCDAPTLRRDMELTIATAASDGLHIESRIVGVHAQDTGNALSSDAPRDDRMVETCSFCKLMNISGHGWIEPTEAARNGQVFDQHTIPQLSHSVCPACEPELRDRLGLAD